MKGISFLRKKIAIAIGKKQAKCYGNELHINRFCRFNSNTCIGNNCHFNGMKVSGIGQVSIGDNFHSGENVKIITQNHDYDHGTRLPYDAAYVVKPVIIGKNVWLGDSVILLPGTKLGDGVIVQAGAVVHGEIPRLAIIGGNPASIIKFRDRAHYDELEEKRLYW